MEIRTGALSVFSIRELKDYLIVFCYAPEDGLTQIKVLGPYDNGLKVMTEEGMAVMPGDVIDWDRVKELLNGCQD